MIPGQSRAISPSKPNLSVEGSYVAMGTLVTKAPKNVQRSLAVAKTRGACHWAAPGADPHWRFCPAMTREQLLFKIREAAAPRCQPGCNRSVFSVSMSADCLTAV